MKFDMSRCWNDAMNLLRQHREIAITLGGVFLFLPALVSGLFQPATPMPQFDGNWETFIQQMALQQEETSVWVGLLTFALAIVTWYGSLCIYVLLLDRQRATVREVLVQALKLVPMYIVTLILMVLFFLAAMLVPGVLIGVAAAAGLAPLAALVVLVMAVLAIYLGMRLVLVMVVLVLEQHNSPVAILQRSWALTKGNVGRLFLFWLIIGLVAGVIFLAVQFVFGTVLAVALPLQVATFVLSGVLGLISAAFTIIGAAVSGAAYFQLGGPASSGEVFE
jgi:hypothetical protein